MLYIFLSLSVGFMVTALLLLLGLGVLLVDIQYPGTFQDSVINAADKLARWCLIVMSVLAACSVIAILVAVIGGGINAH